MAYNQASRAARAPVNPVCARVPPAMICNPYEIVIQGITSEGRTFRPSDWAERLAGILSSFESDQKKLEYHAYVRPLMLDNIRCVAVDKKLEKS